VKDVETNQTVFDGIEIFSSLVSKYALFGNLYLRPPSPLQKELKQALIKLYATALTYLPKKPL
jgi:hypothetical protein